jgi:hypothetical protein
MAESGYGKYIITELKTPEFGKEWNETYAKFAKRILWMDEMRAPKHLQQFYTQGQILN